MSKNRVIYQSEALYVSKQYDSTGVADHEQLRRVQSANYSFSLSREDINEYGILSRIDSINLEAPTVSFDYTYYLTDGFNERALGFYVQTGSGAQGGFASGHLETETGRNFYIVTTSEGLDLNDGTSDGFGTTETLIGLGNGFLSDYTIEGSVGSIPTASVSIEALNIRSNLLEAFATGSGGAIVSGHFDPAAINPANGIPLTNQVVLPTGRSPATGAGIITALRPGDITIDFGTFSGATTGAISSFDGINASHVQSFSLSLPLSRTPLEKLGSKYAYARSVDFPVIATLTVNAIVNEVTAKNLTDLVDTSIERDISVRLNQAGGVGAMIYTLKGCTLDEESFSSSIGSNKSVDLTFSTQIGSATDALHNVLVSGYDSTPIFV